MTEFEVVQVIMIPVFVVVFWWLVVKPLAWLVQRVIDAIRVKTNGL